MDCFFLPAKVDCGNSRTPAQRKQDDGKAVESAATIESNKNSVGN